MRVLPPIALILMSSCAVAEPAGSPNYPKVDVSDTVFLSSPDSQGLFAASVRISMQSCANVSPSTISLDVGSVHGQGEAIEKAKGMVPKLKADLEKDRRFCTK